MRKKLHDLLLSVPEAQDLPIYLIYPDGSSRYYPSVNYLLPLMKDFDNEVYNVNTSVFKDIFNKDKYVVSFVSNEKEVL